MMIPDILINNKSVYDDFDFLLSSKTIAIPKPKTHYIEVAGTDGKLDLSVALTNGEPKYHNRKIEVVLTSLSSKDLWETKKNDFLNLVHGRKIKVSFFSVLNEDEHNFYYEGRAYVNEIIEEKVFKTIKLEIDAEPYKYNIAETKIVKSCTNTLTVTIEPQDMRVVPVINVTNEMTVFFEEKEHRLYSGDNVIADIWLYKEKQSKLVFNGTGTVTITFRGGRL